MISITRTFEFDAAHHLPRHKGKCHNRHGHRFTLEVEIAGGLFMAGGSYGMIMDYTDLKNIVNKEVIDVLDHTDLNESCPVYPTSECMVSWIADTLDLVFKENKIELLRVRLNETPNSYAEWRKT